MEHKVFKADNVSVDDKGHINFRFAKLGVVDHDTDIIQPGAFQQGKTVLLSAWNHGSWSQGGSSLPIGKGIISEENGYAIFDGDFNLATEIGRDHYETVKFNGAIQEYSFGFDILEKTSKIDNTTNRENRVLIKLNTFEASPVLLGAGIETGTNSIKSLGAESTTYQEHAETLLAAIVDFVKRSQSIADLRTEKGKEPASVKNRDNLKAISTDLVKAATELKRIAENDPEADALKSRAEVAAIMSQFEINELVRSFEHGN